MKYRGLRGLCGAAVAAAALLLPAPLSAQDTTTAGMRDTAGMQSATGQRDTSTTQQAGRDTTARDSSLWGYKTDHDPNVKNPPGYRGMERPVNVFPADSTQDPSAGRVEDKVTGTYEDSTWRDSTGQRQNPAGYRGMERPAGLDSASADSSAKGGTGMGAADQRQIDEYTRRLGDMGYKVVKMNKAERKAWKAKAGKHQDDSAASGKAGATENRHGRDTTLVGETSPKIPKDSTRRLPAARGDTTGQSSGTNAGGTARDTTGQ